MEEDKKQKKAEKDKKYYKNNKEKILLRCRLYRSSNKEVLSAYFKDHYKKNTEKKKAASKRFYKENKDLVKEKNKLYREKNKKTIQELKKKYYKSNLEKIRAKEKTYRKNNRSKTNAAKAKYKAQKLRASPKWMTKADFIDIQEWYQIAKDLQWLSEEQLHVDHIVPLRGKTVCGLHVPWNLQVITASENISKGNRL